MASAEVALPVLSSKASSLFHDGVEADVVKGSILRGLTYSFHLIQKISQSEEVDAMRPLMD